MRIVSLCPSLTELVFDLGRGDDLVGRTTFCVHPADRVGAIESVGGTKDPDVDRIVELAPDLVLLNEEENRREDADDLEAANVSTLSTFPRDVAGTAEMVRIIARALDRTDAGEAIARDIEERSERVRAAASGKPPVRWAYLIWRKPWMTVNRDTFADALLRQAGGENVFGDLAERYPEIELADLARADPDVVLLCTEPYPFGREHAGELSAATRIPVKRIQIADGEFLSWHGSRTPRGIDYAAECLDRARG